MEQKIIGITSTDKETEEWMREVRDERNEFLNGRFEVSTLALVSLECEKCSKQNFSSFVVSLYVCVETLATLVTALSQDKFVLVEEVQRQH